MGKTLNANEMRLHKTDTYAKYESEGGNRMYSNGSKGREWREPSVVGRGEGRPMSPKPRANSVLEAP